MTDLTSMAFISVVMLGGHAQRALPALHHHYLFGEGCKWAKPRRVVALPAG